MDFAAPEVILKAAGGTITNLENKELSYGKKNFEQGGIIIASNDVTTHKNKCQEIKENYKIRYLSHRTLIQRRNWRWSWFRI